MNKELEDLVRARAGNRCEYCQLSQHHHGWRFEIDHIIAQQHSGPTEAGNLALCCPKCNRHKGPNLSGIDPETGHVATLFHPRRERWREHFILNGPVIVGITPTGRATAAVLNFNDPVRVAMRQALLAEGVFSPS